jgi:hypothetical protein
MSDTAFRAAGWAAIVSGLAAAVGIVFLVAMFASFAAGATASGQTSGRINDVLVLVSYLLAAPSVVAVHMLLRPRAPLLSGVLAAVGLGAIGAIVVLQYLLISEILTFEQQVGPVSIAILVLGVWFVTTGYLGRSSGLLLRGVRMGLIAATYVGYPIWAIWMGRRLAAGSVATSRPGFAISVEE